MLCSFSFFYISILHFHLFFFFNDTATTEIYTLSLHDALPISLELRDGRAADREHPDLVPCGDTRCSNAESRIDRKSTRLNSSHGYISYAVFCLKKKKKNKKYKINSKKKRDNHAISNHES